MSKTQSEIEYDYVFDGIEYLSDEYFTRLAEESFNRGIQDSTLRFEDLDMSDRVEIALVVQYAHTMAIVGFMKEVENQRQKGA